MAAFSPTAAVVVHSHVSIEAAVLTSLKGEDGLLINRCSFSATRPAITRADINGREFLRVYGPLDASWNVQARQLARSGLGDYHPGRNLSETSLAFANSDFIPFQVGTTFEENQNGQALFIYENPSLDPGPGDLPVIEFTIRVAFADHDTLNYPTTNPGTPDLPDEFVEIPAQSAVELATAARAALLGAAFNGEDPFNDVAMTASLYDASNTLLMGPLDLAAWTTFDESPAYTTRVRNTAQIQWNDANFSDTIATYVRIERNGITLRDITLASPLSIPAYSGVRAPINALAVTLTWPTDGATVGVGNKPSRAFATYAMGGTRAAACGANDNLTIEWWDGDPQAAGASLASLTPVTADGTNFPIMGVVVTPAEQASTGTAPGPGWTSAYVTINNSAGFYVAKEQYAVTVASGAQLPLNDAPPPALMTLNLAATPNP